MSENLNTFSCQILFSKIYWAADTECRQFYDKRYGKVITEEQKSLCRQKVEEMLAQSKGLFKGESLKAVSTALDLFVRKNIENQWWLKSPYVV